LRLLRLLRLLLLLRLLELELLRLLVLLVLLRFWPLRVWKRSLTLSPTCVQLGEDCSLAALLVLQSDWWPTDQGSRKKWQRVFCCPFWGEGVTWRSTKRPKTYLKNTKEISRQI
jgi:hypothetical protein